MRAPDAVRRRLALRAWQVRQQIEERLARQMETRFRRELLKAKPLEARSMREELEEYKARCEALAPDLEAAKECNLELERQIESLSGSSKQLNTLQIENAVVVEENEKLKDEISARTEEKNRLEAELQQLTKEIEDRKEAERLAEAEKQAKKLQKGSFNFEDFLSQLNMIRKMGPLKKVLGMLPGVGAALKNIDLDDKHFKRLEAMIQSMTPKERRKPSLIDVQRRRRVVAPRREHAGERRGDDGRLGHGDNGWKYVPRAAEAVPAARVAALAPKPLWVFHAEDDSVVAVGNSDIVVNKLREAGATRLLAGIVCYNSSLEELRLSGCAVDAAGRSRHTCLCRS